MSAHWSAGPPAESADPLPSLAARQAALVAALVAGAPDPAGFDATRLDATRSALLRKRAGEAAKHWPLLAAALGADWMPTFARVHSGHESMGPLCDGWDVARDVRDRGGLTPGAAAELDEADSRAFYDGQGFPRPHRVPLLRRWFGRR